YGGCILHHIAALGYAEPLRAALRISAGNVNRQDTEGNTPLHWLLRAHHSYRDHTDAARYLLTYGGNAKLKNERGQTPADVYVDNECREYDSRKREEQKEMLMRLLQTGMVPMEILARGHEAMEAFNDALAEGEAEVNQGRTVFMGLERVGKTSTIKSFLRNTFDPNEDITDAIANTKVCTHELHDELNWKEAPPDHSGANDMYEAKMADSIAKKILEQETENVEVTRQSVLSPAKAETKDNQGQSSLNVDARNPKIESDTKEQTQAQSMEEVPETIATKVQERITELKFTRGNATQEWQKSGNDFIMSIWDFGGQPIYHVIQRIFMVSFAVICVVFNLEDDLDSPAKVRDPTTGDIYEHRMTNLEFILYWIRSVYTNSKDSKLDDGQLSPPVLVIGTHLGSLKGNEEEQKRKAEEIFNKIRKALEGKPYETMVSSFFAIENSLSFARSNAFKIMNQILKFAKKMVRKLPLKWLLVQQEIQKLKVEHIYLPTKEVIALVERCGVKQDAQRVLLEYLHDLGEILYFPDDEALRNIIVLDVMQLVDMLKTIITVIDPKLMKPKHREAWRRLDKGILEEHLLRHLWKEFNFSDETFDFFVSLMQKFGLVCEKKITMGGERLFYVLSRLQPKRIDATQTKDYGIRAVSIFHDFGSYLPDDLFQRGVTKFIERFQVKDDEPTLSYEHVELSIDELHLVDLSVASIKHRRMFKTTIIRRKIFNAAQLTREEEPSPIVCKKVLIFLEAELKIFCQSGARGVELTRYIACDCRDAHMHIVRQFDMDVLPCGSNGMEVTRYRRLFEDDVQKQVQLSRRVLGTRVHERQHTDKDDMLKQGFVDDAIIATVSEEMNYSWKGFGVRLGVSWARVNQFCAEERLDSQKAIANMMKYWRKNVKNETHQLKVLCTVLRQHDYKRLAGELFSGDLLSLAKHEGYLTDVDLLFIAERLGKDWKPFGINIGLKDHEIQQIEMSFPPPPIVDAILEMLVKWREKQEPQENYLTKMSNELEAFGKQDISEELNSYYQEKYQ
ncbi:uncharacterized protein LOC117112384, partial [Anneissia japonica]|uniref:uncharacterized protein LOC117112384 n=1 Tax=Anneissia japonica TaxID=1529436 RepID=UPI001425AC16